MKQVARSIMSSRQALPSSAPFWPTLEQEKTMAELRDLPLPRRWQQQLHPMPSVIAIVRRHDDRASSYLLIKRKKEPYIGKWALVGGKWDFGESLQDAVVREVQEETGLVTLFAGLRIVVNYRLTQHLEEDQGAHFLLFVCEAHAPTGEAREHAEGAVSWFSAEELKKLNETGKIVATDYTLIEQCQQTSPQPISYFEAEVSGNGSDMINIVRFETP
jgi:8-oxo-dGTP diphosphatase